MKISPKFFDFLKKIAKKINDFYDNFTYRLGIK